MIVYEYGMVRVIGEESIAKAIQDYGEKGYEPITLTWVGNQEAGRTPSGLIQPGAGDAGQTVGRFILIIRKPVEIPVGNIGIQT